MPMRHPIQGNFRPCGTARRTSSRASMWSPSKESVRARSIPTISWTTSTTPTRRTQRHSSRMMLIFNGSRSTALNREYGLLAFKTGRALWCRAKLAGEIRAKRPARPPWRSRAGTEIRRIYSPSPVVNPARGQTRRVARQLWASCQGSSASPRSAARAASRRYRAGSTSWSFAVSSSE